MKDAIINALQNKLEAFEPGPYLISGGFGSGWVSTHFGKGKIFVLTYAPFIERLNNDGKIDDALWEQFEEDCAERDIVTPYRGATSGLYVYDAEEPFIIDEYDGAERPITISSLIKDLITD